MFSSLDGHYFWFPIGFPVIIMLSVFHILDRQIEFTSRTDFLWKAKLKVEQDEVSRILIHMKLSFIDFGNKLEQGFSTVLS